MNELESLLREGASLKMKIDADTERLRQINMELTAHADFSSKKSASLIGGGVKAKISLRENVKWDQERLQQVRSAMGNEFEQVFKAKYEPVSKKVLDAFLELGDKDMSEGVRWAMTITPGVPSVTYELMEVDHAA